MVKVKNKNNFPLVVNLNEGRSLHLAPLGEDSIKEEDFEAPDLQSKIKRKLVEVTSKPVKKVEVKEEPVKDAEQSSVIPKHKIKKEEGDK